MRNPSPSAAQSCRGPVKRGDHVHPLLLDAERGELRERRRLDPAHPRRERAVAAPALDRHRCAGLDADRVGREQIDHELEHPGVSHLDERCAGLHHALALLEHAQHAARRRREHVEVPIT